MKKNTASNKLFHSVTLDAARCKGCTTCIKQCPTEAIRVRNGKARIIKDRCIDCGQCIRHCPQHAKKAVFDHLDALEDYRYTIALPAPTLYGQFNNLDDVNIVLEGLLLLGFDSIYEVAKAAEILSAVTRETLKDKNVQLPVISSACPAVVRLIRMRFPSLSKHLLKLLAPLELAAIAARKEAMEKTGLASEEIGIFFISPCPAKMTAVKNPIGQKNPVIDGVLSMSEVYVRLLSVMPKVKEPRPLCETGLLGIGWANIGGEASATLREKHISVDGIENVISVLNDIEDGKLSDLDFIELNNCTQGCVGGCNTVENPFIAKTRIRRLMKYLPISRNTYHMEEIEPSNMLWEDHLTYTPSWKLDSDIQSAMEKAAKIESLLQNLPGLDCASCGAPSCRSFAEDVVLGYAEEDDCIFRMREKLQSIANTYGHDEYLPAPFRKK